LRNRLKFVSIAKVRYEGANGNSILSLQILGNGIQSVCSTGYQDQVIPTSCEPVRKQFTDTGGGSCYHRRSLVGLAL
jgi:hypothetical protein